MNKKNSEGLTKYKVRVNYVDSDGKYRQLSRIACGIKNAKAMEAKLNEDIKGQNTEVTDDITFREFHEIYVSNMMYEVRPTTMQKKMQNFRIHIDPYIGHLKLKDINSRVLAVWKTKINQKSLSFQTRKTIYKELHATFEYAVKMEYLSKNPLNKIGNFRDPMAMDKNVDFYTPEEFRLFINVAKEYAVQTGIYDYYIFFMIAYFTGARKGEIHALRWNRYKDGYILIRSSINQKLSKEGFESPPKNKSSIRDIQLPNVLIEVLDEFREIQKSQIADWNEEGFICGYYRPLRDSTIVLENEKYAKKAGLKIIRIHDFRHSHASLLINSNITPLEVSHRLGHTSTEMTLKTYSHLFPRESEKSIAVLDNVL